MFLSDANVSRPGILEEEPEQSLEGRVRRQSVSSGARFTAVHNRHSVSTSGL